MVKMNVFRHNPGHNAVLYDIKYLYRLLLIAYLYTNWFLRIIGFNLKFKLCLGMENYLLLNIDHYLEIVWIFYVYYWTWYKWLPAKINNCLWIWDPGHYLYMPIVCSAAQCRGHGYLFPSTGQNVKAFEKWESHYNNTSTIPYIQL